MKLNNTIYMLLLAALSFPTHAFSGGPEETSLTSQVITADTSWSGTIVIEGVIVIARRATLTINPGTTVLFKRIDSNNDGIGDSEIRVLGGIVAEGTKALPISFRSAEKNPSPKDWSYLLLFTSGSKNTIKYCQFNHAFTGLQVHFSTATIEDCVFDTNLEGIRFGRAKITVAHNLFKNNSIGIRFTRMEGPAEIQNNIVTKNEVGIFLVPSGQNILDFFEPGRTGKAWNDGHLAIYANNVYNNQTYNLKLGEKQMWNLKVSDNWWGSPSATEAQSKIFDKQRDNELGQAQIQPMLSQPHPAAGPR